jgi:hypothetical protein
MFACSLTLLGQQKVLVDQQQQSTYFVDNGDMGRITFAAKDIPLDKYTQADFLTSYELTNRSELFVTAFMNKPLYEHLLTLSPGRSVEEMNTLGGYQFSFHMDERLIYEICLPPDHIEPEDKRTQITFKKSFIAYPRQCSWGESIWNFFLRNGGQEALSDGKHTFKMEIRPFLDTPEKK